MSLKLERQDIINIATGSYKDRDHLDIDVIREQKTAIYKNAQGILEMIYDLTLLEGALICDDFHKTKKTFSDLGEEYGYIHSFTERIDKSNVFRFQYRRPTPSGKIVRKSIKINRTIGGYSPSAFNRAGHELEKELCILIEKDYLALRKESKAIRSALRKLSQYFQEER